MCIRIAPNIAPEIPSNFIQAKHQYVICDVKAFEYTSFSEQRQHEPPRSRFDFVGARVVVGVELDNAEWYDSGLGFGVYGGGGSESLAGKLESPDLGSCLFAIFLILMRR